MKASLRAGVERVEEITVDEARTIAFLGEDMRVYSTPSMVNDAEYACYRLIQEHLHEGESSVGIHVSMDHLGATPLGERVTVRVQVDEVDGRKVSLNCEVHDAAECVGRGRHLRFVIDIDRHAARLAEKVARLGRG
ncbi:MAG: hotdog domain-containing protein [Gammaproteobacteria bacterium]|nr:hotdog domain-containing protein [Gammaproteobacteria bacterium]